jgi:hypothetical protein
LLSQPLAAFHEFLSKIAEMRNWTAERGQAKPQEDQKRLQNRLAETSGLRFLFAGGGITTVFVLLYFTGHGESHRESHSGIERLYLRGRDLNVFKKSHETEIHVEILMAMKQCESRVIGYKIDVNSAEAFDQDSVFENSGSFFSVDLCDLEIMPMQVERVHVVALVDESQSIAATLLDLDRLALIVRLPIDCPNVEPAFTSVDFPNLHGNYFVWCGR